MKSESSCVDNFTIPQGPQGPRGDRGLQGKTGPKGDKGPSGKNKIDIHLREGENPYVLLTPSITNEKALAYIIFPGTSVMTPNSMKIAISYLNSSFSITIILNLYIINSDGTKTLVSSIGSSKSPTTTDTYEILTSNSLNNLSTSESVFGLYGQIFSSVANDKVTKSELKIYAFEMR